MFKSKRLIGIILIILLVFSINGFTEYYKYTQEAGENFYVGTGDKADALEDTNEMRQIIDDLGALLVHSKRDGLYPKNGPFGGTIQIPEAGLKFSNDPVNDDIAAYIAGEMAWQTKAELGIDLSLYYLKTQIDTLSEVEAIYTKDITDSTELAAALGAYYLKTAIDSQGEIETIWGVTLSTDAERNALTYSDVGAEQADAGLTSLAELTYVSPSFIKVTATDTYAIRTLAETKTDLSLNNVENTALSTWIGSGNITTLGTITTGVWNGTALAIDKLPISIVADADVTNIPNCNNVFDFCETTQAYYNAIGDLPTAAVTSGDTTHIPTSGGVYTFCETTQNYALNSELHAAVTIGTANGLSLSTQEISMAVADTDTTGALSDTDWDTFNNKVATEVDPTVDTDAEIKAILVDEVTKVGDFDSGYNVVVNDASGIIQQGTNTDTEIADAVARRHTQNTDTQFDFYSALYSDHTWTGDKDLQPVGETVAFGDLLCFDWAIKEWIKAKADMEATMPGTRIALEAKADGQACLMLVKGYIRDDSAFEFAGAMVYVSATTAGAMTSTAPSTAGNQLQRVGVAKSADILFFDPSIDVGEI